MVNIINIKSRIIAKAREEIGQMANDPTIGEELARALASLKEEMDKKLNWRNKNA